MKRFYVANDEEILSGDVTDSYFQRAQKILEETGISKPVVMEFRANSFPEGTEWAVFAGLEELIISLERLGKPIDLYSVAEGTLIRPEEPVAYLIGDYKDLCVYETAWLGFLCHASGVATRTAQCVHEAEGRPVLSFGTRRIHPGLAPMIERSAFVGGCMGFSNVEAAKRLGLNASGTVPHALVLLVGDTVETMKLFDAIIDPKVPRIALIDTYQDERFEAVRIAEAMENQLYGIRVDTPSSRRGDFLKLLQEIRWELDLRGYEKVRIVASGGMTAERIRELNEVCYGYGVGTFISNAPVIDFSFDIVEIDGVPHSKRGKWSGRKRLLNHGPRFDQREIVSWRKNDSRAGQDMIQPYVVEGKLQQESPEIKKIREWVVNQLAYV